MIVISSKHSELTARDAGLAAGRIMLYPGLAMSSLLVIRGPVGLTVGDLLIAAATCCAVASRYKPQRRLPSLLWASGLLILLGGSLSSVISNGVAESVTIMVRLVYLVVGVPWTLLMLLIEPRHVRRAVGWWLAGISVCCIGALIQLIFGDVISGGSITSSARFTGFTAHPSDLGGIAAIGAAGSFVLASSSESNITRILASIALVSGVAGLTLSGSVSGMIASALAGLLILTRRGISLRQLIIISTFSAAVIGPVIVAQREGRALDPIGRLLQTTGVRATSVDLDTVQTRFELARRAWAEIAEQPLLGYGMASVDNVLFGNFSVHNIALAAWHAGGILTLFGVAVATFLVLREGWLRRPAEPLREAMVATSIAAFVFAQTGPSLYNRYYWVPFALLLVVTVIEAEYRKHGILSRRTPARAIRQDNRRRLRRSD